MPPPPQQQLGSAAYYAQGLASPPDAARISPDTCTQLSLFKDLMREYRKIDDAVTMRLNRAGAQLGGSREDACAFFWTELVANWKGRAEVVRYCVDVVDSAAAAKRAALARDGREGVLGAADARERRRLQAELYADEVQRKAIHDELTVERIIRQRSFDAFRARCKFWTPPRTDAQAEARRWWDEAQTRK